MVYEFTATADTAYFFGLHLVSSDDYKYVLNAHGDVVALVNASGTITKRYEYDAFGVELNPDETDTNPYRYCAEYFDIESGTIYLRARYYSPNHGRFTQLDPARDGLNWYAYCANNPIAFVDPSGCFITLSGTEEEIEKSLAQLQMLTNNELMYDSETGRVTIRKYGAANSGKTLTAGTKLVADAINNNDFEVSIERIYEEDDGCYCYYSDDGKSATIQMNDWSEMDENWGYIVSDGDNGYKWERHGDVAYILLGHELIHATHYMNGSLADPLINVYRYTDTGAVLDDCRWNVFEEYVTTGLPCIVELPANSSGVSVRRFYIPFPNSLNENTLRVEQGLSQRLVY